MELRPEHEGLRLLWELVYLHHFRVGRGTREGHPGLLKPLHIRGINLIAVTVTLLDELLLVGGARHGALLQVRRIHPETHRAAVLVVGQVLLLLKHHIYDRVRRIFLNLGRVSIFQLQDVPRILNDHELHPIAQAEIRDFVLTRIPNGPNLALNAALTEATRDNDAIVLREVVHHPRILLNIFGVYPANLCTLAERNRGELDRLDDREVGVREDEVACVEIFTDNRYLEFLVTIVGLGNKALPGAQVCLAIGEAKDLTQNPA